MAKLEDTYMTTNELIIEKVQERLELGAKKYGSENVVNTGKDFTKEALEEVLDGMVYLCARLIEITEQKKDPPPW